MDDAETTLLGSAFQILAAAIGKAWLPIVDNLKDGTSLCHSFVLVIRRK